MVLPAPRLGPGVPGTPPDAVRSGGGDHRTRPVIPSATGDPPSIRAGAVASKASQTTEIASTGWVGGAYAVGRGGGQPAVRMTASSSEAAHRWMS